MCSSMQIWSSSSPEKASDNPHRACSAQILAATGEAAELAEREIQVMQQLQHPNIMPLLAHSRAMAPMDADQGVTTYYMLFPLFRVWSLFSGHFPLP